MKNKEDKLRVSWLKRLVNTLNYYDVQYDYKLIPALIVLLCLLSIACFILAFVVIG